MTSKEKLIYLAGLFDGEGSVWRGKCYTNKRKRTYYQSRLLITNTDMNILNWLVAEFGMALSKHPGGRGNPLTSTKQCYSARLNGAKAEVLAKKLQPYLIIKREAIKKVLDYPWFKCKTKGCKTKFYKPDKKHCGRHWKRELNDLEGLSNNGTLM